MNFKNMDYTYLGGTEMMGEKECFLFPRPR